MAKRLLLSILYLFFYSASFGVEVPTKAEDITPFESNGKFGLKNTSGQVLIPAQYDQLGWSNGAFSIIENVTGYFANNKWGLINLSNHKITKAEFEDLSPGQGSIIVARKKLPNSVKVKTGCITPSGKILVPFMYDGLSVVSLRAIVYDKNNLQFRHGLIDLENHVLIPINYAAIYPLGSLRYGVVDFNGKTAIFTEEGKQLTQFTIDSLSSFKKDFAIVFQNRKQGLINRAGEMILQPSYREIRIQDDGKILTRMEDNWFFIDGENKQLRELQADSVHAVMKDLYKISSSNRVQLVDKDFKPLSTNTFSAIGDFANGRAIYRNNNLSGVINQDGKIIINAAYNDLFPENDYSFLRGTLTNDSDKRWVLLDAAGKSITQKNYQYIGSFNGKFFPVKYKGYWGAIDRQGKEIVACVHDSLLKCNDNYIAVKFKSQYGIINAKEDWIITPRPHRLELIRDDLYLEDVPPNKFLKSVKGGVIYFTQNPLQIKKDHLLEILPSGAQLKISFTGVIIERLMEDDGIEKVFTESEGYRAIRKDGRYGFIDNRSRLRIANRYEDVKNFSEGLAPAKILGKWGYIGKDDKIAVQPVYEEVFPFKQGFAIVRQKSNYGVIDKTGKVVLPVRYESIEILPSRRLKIKQDGFFGLADTDGKILINPKNQIIEEVENGYVIVGRDSKFGVVTIQGLSTIPLIYDALKYDTFHKQFIAMKKAEWQMK